MVLKQNLRIKISGNHTNQTKDSDGTTVVRLEDITDEEKRMLEGIKRLREGDISPVVKTIHSTQNISLDEKVNEYIDWNFQNMAKGKYTNIGEYWSPVELRNFIEKMAVWYELRYPDYEINRLMPGSGQEGIKVSDVMFNSNIYINDLLGKNSDVRALDWDKFYNTSAFINSLPHKERYRFQKVKYNGLVYVDPEYEFGGSNNVLTVQPHLHLTSNGFVEGSEGLRTFSENKVTDTELKGMHIKKVVELLKEKGVILPKNNELEKTINNVENWKKQKEGLLDCVMYRIIERGGNRMGTRRGFLFAKEFGRNIDIPMMYAVDYSDPGLKKFLIEYIKAGGSKDLMCYVGYFSRISNDESLHTVSVESLLKTVHNNCEEKYTTEETALHQRFVDALSSQIDQEELRNDKVRRKSKKNKR